MTDVGMAIATGCDCPQYPAEVERDCCCIGGTECIDGRKRPVLLDAPTFDHPLTNDCIGGGCEECERDITDLASMEALLAQALAEVSDGYGPGEGSVRWASDIAGTPSGSRLIALAIRGAR